mmetsp:Transcript_3364/g.2817  ORF Transcript_3364/g.2817 Transcript_3364/m.2817 type:complete len:95 (+) Transcript_3364:839-1123(+)
MLSNLRFKTRESLNFFSPQKETEKLLEKEDIEETIIRNSISNKSISSFQITPRLSYTFMSPQGRNKYSNNLLNLACKSGDSSILNLNSFSNRNR